LDEASGYAISEKESTDAPPRNITKFRPFYEIKVQKRMAIEKGGGLEKTLRNHKVDFPFLNACCSIIGN
jgi:hypothetical protein